ncbi:TCAM1 protein, partial [Halcyon senegalensis]|nr:TCAM1 protein [Halcyon senegalensis]
MAQGAEPRPSLEDVFHVLSQMPQDQLLGLEHKLKHWPAGPGSKLLQAMVLLALGQEAKARICLDALGDNGVAQYIHQAKLDAAGGQESGEGLQPPQLEAGAVELLAQVCSLLAEEKLCGRDAADKACQAATNTCQAATNTCNASKETQGDTLNSTPPRDQEKQVSTVSSGPSDRFLTLRSDVDAGSPVRASPNYVVRSSPVQIRGSSALAGPQTLCSLESPSLTSHFEISASPTVVFHTPPPSPERVPQPSRPREGSTGGAGWPDGDRARHGPWETSWVSSPSSQPGQVPRPENVPQVSSRDPSLPTPDTEVPAVGAVNQPVESSDVSSTVAAEPHSPEENMDKKQDEKPSSTDLPNAGATADTGPAHMSMEESCPPAGIPSNAASASCVTQPLPPPTYSFSTLPPLQGVPSNSSYPPPLLSSPSPAWHPPLKTVDRVPTSEPDGAERKFFTFVVLHASEDETVAHRVKNLLENMGVPDGATLCEDFSIAGRSHMTCFQDAIENSAFIILLLTKNFPCNLCMFQTDTALMESIHNPAKHHSVIPFIPKDNPLEQIPSTLSGLVSLDEKSPLFSKRVQKTFTTRSIEAKKLMWDQRRKRQLHQDRHQTLPDISALNLSSHPQEPPLA